MTTDPKMKKGIFITFEGGEGSGKSTQCRLLFEALTQRGCDCILAREPGGDEVCESIREIVLKGAQDKLEDLSEALLYMASRAQHWNRTLKPALDRGKVIICDRFQDSSTVYQGVCKGVSIDLLNRIYNEATSGIKPERTYLIDIPPSIGIQRSLAKKGNDETRFENMDLSYHEKVRASYLDLAHTDPERFMIIDGTLPPATISSMINADMERLLIEVI